MVNGTTFTLSYIFQFLFYRSEVQAGLIESFSAQGLTS